MKDLVKSPSKAPGRLRPAKPQSLGELDLNQFKSLGIALRAESQWRNVHSRKAGKSWREPCGLVASEPQAAPPALAQPLRSARRAGQGPVPSPASRLGLSLWEEQAASSSPLPCASEALLSVA